MYTNAPRTAISELIVLFDHVLQENDYSLDQWHSLLWNLHNIRADHWDMRPIRGNRTIRELVRHIGQTWLLFSSHSFRNEDRDWNDPSINGTLPGDTREEVIDWLYRAHRELRSDFIRLTDADLCTTRTAPWGDAYPTRRLIELQIQQSIYHTGEINHIRAQLQGNDGWSHQDWGRESGIETLSAAGD